MALISRKGGSGKTTLAVALAVAHEQAGGVAVVVDLDPQGSARTWSELRRHKSPLVASARPQTLVRVLQAARSAGATLALVDTGPREGGGTREAARQADFVLIPSRPAAYDLATVPDTLAAIGSAGSGDGPGGGPGYQIGSEWRPSPRQRSRPAVRRRCCSASHWSIQAGDISHLQGADPVEHVGEPSGLQARAFPVAGVVEEEGGRQLTGSLTRPRSGAPGEARLRAGRPVLSGLEAEPDQLLLDELDRQRFEAG